MNEAVAKFLANTFINLPFVTRATGCVQPLPVKDGVIIPVSTYVFKDNPQNVTTCETTADHYPLVPDSKEIGILYFEADTDARQLATNSRYDTWTGELKLVFWVNMKRTGTGENRLAELEEALTNALPKEIPVQNKIFGSRLSWSRDLAKNSNPFQRYSYDEAKKKFLSPPYGYFSKTVRYKVLAARNCPSTITLTPELC